MSATDPATRKEGAWQAVRVLADHEGPVLGEAVQECPKLALGCELLKAEVLPALRNRVGEFEDALRAGAGGGRPGRCPWGSPGQALTFWATSQPPWTAPPWALPSAPCGW